MQALMAMATLEEGVEAGLEAQGVELVAQSLNQGVEEHVRLGLHPRALRLKLPVSQQYVLQR